ncbi:phage tail tape measure C-terminal domain-containing protein [Paracoccus sp. (in: a-proteobacteria)]|uniref:phage tail tape measure C-terminal domain-containing protein n=1 Tax=Paracoccus sp. TaxID=267 RepID=UPI0026E04187|nr:phage tail tape measure C-terminal domain-containing protein [Paracoccus sp. (in: a-proteobacteria)]MDO5648866.1 phage tail tape measure C-terminal domain-containing protein [Paracoccus sp. (in: a-proteobacteria)]
MTTDMKAKLVVTADASGIVGELKRAVAALDDVARASQVAGQNAARAGQDQANVAQAVKDATETMRRETAAARTQTDALAKSLADQDTRMKALRASLETGAKLQNQYAVGQEHLNRALADGMISADDHASILSALKAEYDRASDAARALADAQVDLDADSTQIVDTFGGVIDQLGEFISNADRAAGAGSKLSQVLIRQLGQMALGAVTGGIGAGAAILMGYATSLMTTADRATEFEKNTRALDDSISRLSQSLGLLRDQRLEQTFGSMAGSVRELSSVMVELDRAAQLKNLRASLDDVLKKSLDPGWVKKLLNRGTGDVRPGAVEAQQRILESNRFASLGAGVSYDEFTVRRDLAMARAEAGEVEAAIKEVARLARDMANGGPISGMNEELQTIMQSLYALVRTTAEFEAQWNGTADAAKRMAEENGRFMDQAATAFYKRQSDALIAAAEYEQTFTRQLALAQAEQRHGAESAQVQAMKAQYAREELDERMRLSGISEDERARLLVIFDATVDTTNQTAVWAATMSDVGAELRGIMSMLTSIGGGAINNAATRTRVEALRAGKSVAEAARAESEFRADLEYRARLAGAQNRFERFQIEEGERLRKENDALTEAAIARDRANRGGRRGGGRGAKRSGGRDPGAKDARDYQRLVAEIDREIGKLQPSYERDAAAAEKWRKDALEGLAKTSLGYAEFAADVEAIYQGRMKDAYENDLKRRSDWAAGVERAYAQMRDNTTTFADAAEGAFKTMADGAEAAFVRFSTSGKASLSDLLNSFADFAAKMAWQTSIAPGFGNIINSVLGGFSGVTLPTAHTGGRGVMRTYSHGNRQRSDEQLAMLRDGEQVFTPQMMENAGSIVGLLAGMASQRSAPVATDTRPVITVVNNSSAQVTGRVEEAPDERGQRQYRLVMDDVVASAIGVSGGRTQRAMKSQYGIGRAGIVR